MTVEPSGVQWVGPGQQSVTVTARLRLDVDDALDEVSMAPVVPAGWSVTGAAVTSREMRLGQVLEGRWTVTSPAGADVSSAKIPVVASFETLGRPNKVSRDLRVQLRPADRVFMREAEDSRNQLGSSGITSCSPCSGGQKVRNIGGSADAYVLFEDVTVDTASEHALFIDFTVNGDRSFFVTVNGGSPIEVAVSGVGNNTPYTTSVPVTLRAGANTIKVHNDEDSAPDLDRLSLS
ncbi:NEW3 domain-containing protein [Micromonospora costi]|nr:NEW3 domain-containing protein [Micromonospora costi]